jgi:transcription elongation GreA/GreB family factor
MKKILIALVILVVLGALCAGLAAIGGGGAWFYLRQSSQAQFEEIERELMDLERMEAEAQAEALAEAERLEREAQEAAAAQAALEAQEAQLEEIEQAEEVGAEAQAQATQPAPRARTRAPAATRTEPDEGELTGVRVVSDDEFDEDEELDLGSIDELLGDDDPMGDIEILDDDPDDKKRKKKKR